MTVVGFAYGAGRWLAKGIIALWVAVVPVSAQTIAVLGDSLVSGYGLPADMGFVPQMQAVLGDKVVLINAGVSGDTTAGGLARLDWTLTDDVDGLAVVLGGNDFLRGIDPASTQANLEALVTGALARDVPVLLVAMTAPSNYGPDYKTAFDAIYGDLAAAYGVSLAPPFLGSLAGLSPEALLAVLQGDGLHPNENGVMRIVDDLRQSFLGFADSLN